MYIQTEYTWYTTPKYQYWFRAILGRFSKKKNSNETSTSIVISDFWNFCFFPKPLTNPHLVAAIFAELDAAHHLLVDEVSRDLVLRRIVPRSEDLLAEEQPPGGVAFVRTLLLRVLFALRYRVHHVIVAAAQRRHLVDGKATWSDRRVSGSDV